jgi:sarcosine oxidase
MKVAVVGCGVMGAATARALVKRGHEVVVYEQFIPGHAWGSSHGQSRIYRYSYPDARYVGMMDEALPLWHELEAESGEALLTKVGGLDTGKALAEHRAALDEHGIDYEMLAPDEVTRRWPTMKVASEALYQKDGGYVLAERAVQAFLDSALRAGITLLDERRIDEISPGGFRDYDVTVVTAGGWARELLATCGIDLPIKPTRETVAYFKAEEVLPTLVDWGEPSVYSLPDPTYGLKVGEHIAGPETDPNDLHQEPNMESVERLRRWVTDRYTNVDPSPMHFETCIYTNTADEHFILERKDNIVIGSACSGHGFKFAPLIGKRLADLAEA